MPIDITERVGILAYGSLMDDAGVEITSATVKILKDGVTTPFTVEFARSSKTRAGAPTLVPFENGGSPVPAQILVLKAEVSEKEAASLLWRRETNNIGSDLEYIAPSDLGPDTVLVDRLENFHGVEVVLYTKIAPNIEPLTAGKLAELALHSARVIHDGRDGISYLMAAHNHGIKTPLSVLYEAEVTRQVGVNDLKTALKKMQSAAEPGADERATWRPPDPSAAEDVAAAANGHRPPGVPSQAPVRPPGIYQAQFFSVLDEIVSGTVNIKSQSSIFEDRPDAVARLLKLSRRLDDAVNSEALYRQAYFAATLWKANPSISGTVSAVIDDIEFSSSRNSPIYTVIRGLQASLIYLSLGGILLFVISSFLYSWSSGMRWEQVITGPYFHLLTSPVIVASTFGMLGAVVSVLLRLSEFENAARRSRDFLRITGVMLPVVGAVFASVTCALFASGMINFSFATGSDQKMLLNNTYFFIVIGFLSGFSERFTRGLLGTAENALTATRRETQTEEIDGATRRVTEERTAVIEKKGS